jgi:hypothetical protein
MTDVPDTGQGSGRRSDDAPPPKLPVFAKWVDDATGSNAVGNLPASGQGRDTLSGGQQDDAITVDTRRPAPVDFATRAGEEGEEFEMQPSAADMTAGVIDLFRDDIGLARKLDTAFKDPNFPTLVDARITAADPERPPVDLDQVRANVRDIINQIGARPADKNAAIRWAVNFWQVAKTTGLISLLGFGLRTGVQSLTAQGLNLGEPDQNTGLAEGIYYTGQAASTLIMLTSATLNAKDKNWDATTGDLIYAVSMVGAAGFAKSYDVAAGLVTSTAGAAFYATLTEILKTFKTMKVPQMAGVNPTGMRKVGVYMAGATTFTASFVAATAWSYSKDYTGPGGFPELDPGDRFRKGAMIGLLWAGALAGYAALTPPLVKLAAGNEFGAIAPLEYEAAWKSNKELLKKSPKELLKSALMVANDANKFFAFVLVFNSFLALDGGQRLGPSGEDAIPNQALRIFTNTVISSVFCQVLCYIYEMQYGTKKQTPSEVLTEGSEGHQRVQDALAALGTEVYGAEEPVLVEDLPEIIGRHATTLKTDAEGALYTVLVYTDTVPRAIEEDRVATPVPSPQHSEAAHSDRGDPEQDDPERAPTPARSEGARSEGARSAPEDLERAVTPPPEEEVPREPVPPKEGQSS